jgi:hypothetical protein
MENATWGLLGPETATSQRRTRTLGLGAAVRSFNDLAVPGLGGAWFGKQLLLAVLGVAVAEKARGHGLRVQNIEVANAGYKPYYSRTVLDHVTHWVMGDVQKVWSLTEALSPLEPMPPPACELLRERLARGPTYEASRREAGLKWVAGLREHAPQRLDWGLRPPVLEEAHWRDMHSGALFFAARDAAVALLDHIESYLGNQGDEQRLYLHAALPGTVADQIRGVRASAASFLERGHDPSPDGVASHFCRECTSADDATLLAMLVTRCEGRGLQLRTSGDIVPGVAFRGAQARGAPARSPEDDGAETELEQAIPLPDHISNRVRNLFLLDLDLRRELGGWLSQPAADTGAAP